MCLAMNEENRKGKALTALLKRAISSINARIMHRMIQGFDLHDPVAFAMVLISLAWLPGETCMCAVQDSVAARSRGGEASHLNSYLTV
jgi:hypothetical protein